MPEIVEVRRYADFLIKHLKNNKIINIKILKGRYKKHKPFEGYYKLVNSLPIKVTNVMTKGKFIYFILDNNMILFNTLGLSGGWVYSNDTAHEKEKPNVKHPTVHEFLNKNDVEQYRMMSSNHLNIMFELQSNTGDLSYIYYFDMLSYGTIKVGTNEDLETKLSKIGPDFLDVNFTEEIFIERIKKKTNLNKMIGNVLMNQKVVSGIGNYIRADSLWLAKISPHRLINKLSDDEIVTIFKSIRALVWSDYNYKKAVKYGFIKKNFKTAQKHGRDFFIYYYDDDIHGNKVIKEEMYEGSQKRFIYWVKNIQK
jgi:formamidopyrimidine-DNA glycosylase